MAFAWISLATLMLTDLYIMLVASGAFSDPAHLQLVATGEMSYGYPTNQPTSSVTPTTS